MTIDEQVVYSGIVALIGVWFWAWSVADSFLGDESRFASASRGVWVAVCALIPVLGGVLYLVLGRNFPRQESPNE